MSRDKIYPTTTYPSIVGQILARKRGEQRIEQAEIAAKVGVTQSTWSRIERGESAFTIEQLAKAAKALGCKPHNILEDADRAKVQLRDQGVEIQDSRIDKKKQMTNGLAIIGAAALGGLIGVALTKKENDSH
ncbi:helix-turn-helix domain-containing protein [Candidatus Venteria ishoeyi]|uniref:Helix-turn-helix n=1 Tax=Candidatus Venteria ishoeyi TaxID=1899563 RepID=A0A1H6F3D7_9GAMM|nr:helix-turn-helix transcriptional regulator [Candidatus Venteria ishoeyi]SEH04592.1 Helix-turn-helix [Candidatus Venteria ishoeyi]